LQHRAELVKPRAEIERLFNLTETVDRYEKHLRRAARP